MQGYHKPSIYKNKKQNKKTLTHKKAKHNKQGIPLFENQRFPPSRTVVS